jgi:hypothetical protein
MAVLLKKTKDERQAELHEEITRPLKMMGF